jgi:hypothetical protein
MSKIVACKRMAAILLLLAFFLPLSQCTVEQQTPDGKAVEPTTVVTSAYSSHEWPSADALATYGSFLWPLMLAVASLIWPALSKRAAIGVLELLLCAGSAYVLLTLIYFGDIRYGAYVAAGAIGTYFIATSVELAARLRWRLIFPTRRGGSGS